MIIHFVVLFHSELSILIPKTPSCSNSRSAGADTAKHRLNLSTHINTLTKPRRKFCQISPALVFCREVRTVPLREPPRQRCGDAAAVWANPAAVGEPAATPLNCAESSLLYMSFLRKGPRVDPASLCARPTNGRFHVLRMSKSSQTRFSS